MWMLPVMSRDLNDFFDKAYKDLKSLAGKKMRHERPGHSLVPTALVHEVFVALKEQEREFENTAHFFHTAALAMQRQLVDCSRKKTAGKRGGGYKRVFIDSNALVDFDSILCDPWKILAVDEMLQRLEERLPKRACAALARLRYFAGCTLKEAAQIVGLNYENAKNDWQFAARWMAIEWNKGD